jgi:peptide/nickel transport system permease protein
MWVTTLGKFLARRALTLVPLLAFLLIVTFALVRVGDQDPVALLAGPTATATELADVRSRLALDQPVWRQFLHYTGGLLHGDLGVSWLSNRPVLNDLLDRAPATLELLFWGVGIGTLIGVPVGLHAAQRRNGAFDQISRVLALLGFSIPTYWLALCMLLVFFYWLGWSPPAMGRISLMFTPPPRVTGSYLIDGLLAGQADVARSAFAQLVLPVVCVAIIAAAPIIKQTRAIAGEILASDYIRHARALGLSQRTIARMLLRNARVPVLTLAGSELAGLVGTTSLIEYVFAWGGLGQLGLNAIIRGDFIVVQGYVLTLGLFSILVFLAIDLLVLALEPRARA